MQQTETVKKQRVGRRQPARRCVGLSADDARRRRFVVL